MKLNSFYGLALIVMLSACGTQSEKENPNLQQNIDSTASNQEEIEVAELAKTLPANAIVRVPVLANGELDHSKAEVRSTSQKLSSDADLKKSFENANAETVKSIAQADDLDSDSSTNSWAILPWRRMVELTLFGGGAGAAPRHHFRHRGCGRSCAPVQPIVTNPCCGSQTIVTTTCCTTTQNFIQNGFVNPVYYNFGGQSWGYNYMNQSAIHGGYQYLGFQNGWL